MYQILTCRSVAIRCRIVVMLLQRFGEHTLDLLFGELELTQPRLGGRPGRGGGNKVGAIDKCSVSKVVGLLEERIHLTKDIVFVIS